MIRCIKCGKAEMSTGLTADLAHLVEVKRCNNCGGPRTFKCPRCGYHVRMRKVK